MSVNSKTVPLQLIRGVPIQAIPWFTKKIIEDAMDYPPRDGDVILASYPKTGTHWMQYIVLQVISGGEFFPPFCDTIYKVVPSMEMNETSTLESLPEPRIYKTHFSYDVVTKNPKSKVLYIYRKPEDVFASYYHFMNEISDENFDFDDCFEDFISGKVGHGRCFEHLLTYLAHKKDKNLLLISYEKLHRNRREEILRIAKFLGNDYYQHLIDNEPALDKVIEHTSFDYMKKNLIFDLSAVQGKDGKALSQPKVVNFFRKGTVGDGKKTLSLEQLQRLRSVAEEIMKGTEVLREWYEE